MTPEEYLARVRSLLPTLRERAVHAEQLRRLPDETFKDFQAAGLFRCLQPKRYGGYELDPGTFYQAVMDSNPIQRAWRDVHAIRAHAGNNPEKAAAIFGRSEFGLPPLDVRF